MGPSGRLQAGAACEGHPHYGGSPGALESRLNLDQLERQSSLLLRLAPDVRQGLRLREILALKRADLFPDHVHVAGSWGELGLQQTKTKRVDYIPLPAFVFQTIMTWCNIKGFVFSFKFGGAAR